MDAAAVERSDERPENGGGRGSVSATSAARIKSTGGVKTWGEEEGKVKERGERERVSTGEGGSGGTAEVDTNEEPL